MRHVKLHAWMVVQGHVPFCNDGLTSGTAQLQAAAKAKDRPHQAVMAVRRGCQWRQRNLQSITSPDQAVRP